MHHYQVLVGWSPDDELFVAQVPDLPGCVAHGGSENEALANARDAVRLYLDVLSESGDSIPEPREYHLLPV